MKCSFFNNRVPMKLWEDTEACETDVAGRSGLGFLSVNKRHSANDKWTLFTTSVRYPPLAYREQASLRQWGGLWWNLPAEQSLSWEAPATHPVIGHISRVKEGEGREHFAAQETGRLLNGTGGRHGQNEKSDCKPEHPGFCWVFWSLTVSCHTESYFIAYPCHYSVVCNLQPLEVIYPNFLHSRFTHEWKVDLVLEQLVQMLWLTLALSPASHTGHNRALLSAKQRQHVKKNQWKQGEKMPLALLGF